MWYNHKFFKYATGALLALLIIYMLGRVDFFLAPFRKLLATIFTPLLVATIFYYILKPLVHLLQKLHVPRTPAILLAFIIVLTLFSLISVYTGAIIADQFNQINQMIKDLPQNFDIVRQKADDLINNPWLRDNIPLESLQQKAIGILQGSTKSVSAVLFGLLSTVTNIGTLLLLVPFILFYFLKDDRKFARKFLNILPAKHSKNVEIILRDIDGALSSYILGQMTVALAIGVLMYIGYLIIRLKYALVLAIFAMLTCIIPFFGSWIGIVPAVLLSLMSNPFMAVKVFIVMQVVQQIDNNFISPQVMGKRLDIHPITVILLLMIGMSLYGFVGLLIIIPAYAALKVTLKNVLEIYFDIHLFEEPQVKPGRKIILRTLKGRKH